MKRSARYQLCSLGDLEERGCISKIEEERAAERRRVFGRAPRRMASNTTAVAVESVQDTLAVMKSMHILKAQREALALSKAACDNGQRTIESMHATIEGLEEQLRSAERSMEKMELELRALLESAHRDEAAIAARRAELQQLRARHGELLEDPRLKRGRKLVEAARRDPSGFGWREHQEFASMSQPPPPMPHHYQRLCSLLVGSGPGWVYPPGVTVKDTYPHLFSMRPAAPATARALFLNPARSSPSHCSTVTSSDSMSEEDPDAIPGTPKSP